MKITLTSKYINESIPQFYNVFHTANPVLISTQTGSGKTHFITNTLIPAFLNQYGRYGVDIVILSNRIALDTQIKKSISELLRKQYPNMFPYETFLQDHRMRLLLQNELFFSVRKEGEFPIVYSSYNCNIIILKYQQISIMQKYLHHPYRLLIMDEVHYFLADSLFNPYTRFLKNIIKNNQNAIRVYISATPFGISNLLQHYENEFAHLHNFNQPFETLRKFNYGINLSPNTSVHPIPIIPGSTNNFTEITSDINYSVYDSFFFHKYEEIAQQIKNTPVTEKWLIFVNKISEGKQLQQLLKKNSISAVFLHAQNKKIKTWKELLHRNQFSAQVLVATKVLDNGFSLKNSEKDNFYLKHIVLPFIDEITLKQMIGRKRLDDGERVNLYFKIPTKQEVSSQFRSYAQMRNVIYLYKHHGSRIMPLLWEKQNSHINNLFYIMDSSQLRTKSPNSESASSEDNTDSSTNDFMGAEELAAELTKLPLESATNETSTETESSSEQCNGGLPSKRPKVSKSLAKQYLYLNPQAKHYVDMLFNYYNNIFRYTDLCGGNITAGYLYLLSSMLNKPVENFYSVNNLRDSLSSFCLPIIQRYIRSDGIDANEFTRLHTELLPAFTFLPKRYSRHSSKRIKADVNHILEHCAPPYVVMKHKNRFYIKLKETKE